MCKQLLLVLLLSVSSIVKAQTWQNVGTGLAGDVHGFTVWNNLLAIGGSFNNNPCDKIAAWDSTAYSCFNTGIGTVVRAVIPFEGDLVAVGDFWNINQPCTDCNGVARWDGTQWTNMGTGFDNDVLCLTIWNGDLVAGGDFTTADGNPCSRVARWDGSAWQPIGGPTTFDNDIRALAVYDGELWAGGDFSNAGGCTACDRIVRWDGSAWVGGNSGVDIAGGLDSTVRALYVDPVANKLYMGGHFLNVNGDVNCSGVAVYDGNAWAPLGSGVNSYVRAIHKYNGNIIVGGDFTSASGTPASKVAKWKPSTSTWSAMGAGMNGYIRALQEYKGELYAGGEFTEADGLSREYIAKWKEVATAAPVAAFSLSSSTLCAGQCLSFTDGSTGSPTSWSWTFAGGSITSSTLQNPGSVCWSSPGTYTISLQVCSSAGCNTSTQTITVSIALANAGPDATVCNGQSLTLNGGGGSTYSWLPATDLSCTTCASPVSSPLNSITYTLTVTDAAGCTDTDEVTLTVSSAAADAGMDQLICIGQSVMLIASGGSYYSWSPSIALSCSTCPNPIANPSVSTAYEVTATDASGCQDVDTVVVTVDLCTDISEAGTAMISLYPNPFSNNATVQIVPFTEAMNVRLTDVAGKELQVVTTKSSSGIELQMSDLPQGLYFIQVYEGNKLLGTLKALQSH
jgi:PKD repeat protein